MPGEWEWGTGPSGEAPAAGEELAANGDEAARVGGVARAGAGHIGHEIREEGKHGGRAESKRPRRNACRVRKRISFGGRLSGR